MKAEDLSDEQYKRLLDAIQICESLRGDNRVEFKAGEAAGWLSKLFDACADFANETEMALPF